MSNEVTLYENKKQDISIHIFGPYDRFNFGDLLFPIVLEHYLKVNISQANCCFFGTFNFDLTKRGGYHGRGYTELIKSLSKQKNRIVIVAGGEVLGASWHILYFYKSQWYSFLCSNKFFKKLLIKLNISRILNKSRTNMPFNINKNDFPINTLAIYNSVGGIYLDDFSEFKNQSFINLLGVRDNLTFKKAKTAEIDNVGLYPDSAIMISSIITDQRLDNDKNIRPFIREFQNNQFCVFQISDHHAKELVDKISEQLTYIADTLNVRILLCPFAKLAGHSNQIPLKQILKKSKGKFIYINSPSLSEIVFLIRHCKFFIGSSLHGIIVSMSYSKPYFAIGKNHTKLQEYLKTWGQHEYSEVSNPENFAQKVVNSDLEETKTNLLNETANQKQSYLEFIKKISKLILDTANHEK